VNLDLSPRDRRRYFAIVRIPSSGFPGPGRWVRLDHLRLTLRVYDLRNHAVTFPEIGRQLRMTRHQARRAFAVAERAIVGVETWQGLEAHLSQCARCHWSTSEADADRWCNIGRRLARRLGVLLPARREGLGSR
jgi:hypothetical protein